MPSFLLLLLPLPPHPHTYLESIRQQLSPIGEQAISQGEVAERRLRGQKADRSEGEFAEEGGGDLVERGFFDGAPGLAGLGWAEVGVAVGAVVLGVGQHQFVGQAVEGAAGNAEMVGFEAVVFDAGGDGAAAGAGAGAGGAGTAEAVAGPGGVVGAFGGE